MALPEVPAHEAPQPEPGWRHARATPSLAEAYRSVPVEGTSIVAEAAGVRGARVSHRGRLHGPGQLGDGSRGRVGVWISAAVCDPAVESYGGAAAGALVEARHRHRPRSRAGVPRSLFASGRDLPVDHLRDRDRGVRSGRGDRLGDRAQSALPHSDRARSRHHRRSMCSSCSFCRRRGSGGSKRS